MRVAVITPYFKESVKILEQCHSSVMSQTYPCSHVLVADGFPQHEVMGWSVQHLSLPKPSGAGGTLPKAVGAMFAIKQGFDALAFLDGDNWYLPEHIASLVELHRSSKAPVCVASRSMRRLDGTVLPLRGPGEDRGHVDNNCLFLTRDAFRIVYLWVSMPTQFGPIDDRIITLALHGRRWGVSRTGQETVAYRTAYAEDYIKAGESVPPGAKSYIDVLEAQHRFNSLTADQKRRILNYETVSMAPLPLAESNNS